MMYKAWLYVRGGRLRIQSGQNWRRSNFHCIWTFFLRTPRLGEPQEVPQEIWKPH